MFKRPTPLKRRKVEVAGENPHRNISAPQEDTQLNPQRNISAPQEDTQAAKTTRDLIKPPMAQSSSMSLKHQQAKHAAVSQAKQDCCVGNFRPFDSSFGNFLVPVIPTREELLK